MTTFTTSTAESDVTPVPVALPVVPAPKRKRSAIVYSCYAWLGVLLCAALLAGVLPVAGYSEPVDTSRLRPGLGSIDLLLGTDSFGRSILARCIHGAQVSLLIGLMAATAGLVVGTTLGLLGGYLGRRTDWVISLLTDAMLAFPPLILLLALASILTPSITTITAGLTLLTIPTFVRLARAQTIAWSSREFVRAAKNMGASNTRILIKEILPNVLPALGAFFPIVAAALIVAEGSLSFLGFGIPSPRPSWGGMINDGRSSIATDPHLVFVPAAVIFLTVFALNQVGDHLRQRFDRTMHD
ncbi:ABC transporter permease [Nocardioides sp. cx-169]|uniref:ABC transporter permease n=1 Tax=Nocardioides sp. cx-169 TaxID=2899080 RepID=UPI001E4191F7|nr:ABC transporter permease [Nocardioides sp. cx-169]MCD4533637.1 ABC transporter permease [Nocardioides sp. cx-169]